MTGVNMVTKPEINGKMGASVQRFLKLTLHSTRSTCTLRWTLACSWLVAHPVLIASPIYASWRISDAPERQVRFLFVPNLLSSLLKSGMQHHPLSWLNVLKFPGKDAHLLLSQLMRQAVRRSRQVGIIVIEGPRLVGAPGISLTDRWTHQCISLGFHSLDNFCPRNVTWGARKWDIGEES